MKRGKDWLFWKSVAEEVRPKWTGWSSHLAWGALIVLAVDRVSALGWGFTISVLAALGWEIGGHFLSGRVWRAGIIDAVFWIVGAIAAALLAIATG